MIELRFPGPTTPDPYTVGDVLPTVVEDFPEDVAASSMDEYAVGRCQRAVLAARALGREPDFSQLPCVNCGLVPAEHRVKLEGREEYVIPGERRGGQRPDPAWERNGTIAKALCSDNARARFTKDYFMLVVPRLDRPCPTITATGSQVGAASVTHPTECRKMTPREVATISGLPQDCFLGDKNATRAQRYERVGRGVPPPLYEVIGGYLAGLLDRVDPLG